MKRCICSFSCLYQFISCRSLVRSWLLMKAHASMDVLLGRPAASPIHKDNSDSRFGSVRKEGYLYITGWHTHLIGHHPVSLLGNVNCYPTTEVPVFSCPRLKQCQICDIHTWRQTRNCAPMGPAPLRTPIFLNYLDLAHGALTFLPAASFSLMTVTTLQKLFFFTKLHRTVFCYKNWLVLLQPMIVSWCDPWLWMLWEWLESRMGCK